jgi:hypothetical protein
MATMAMITIKRGPIELKCPRNELVEVVETADGVSFTFKGNLQLYYTQQFMPDTVKKLMKQASDNFPDKNIIFNLDNPKVPALIDAT